MPFPLATGDETHDYEAIVLELHLGMSERARAARPPYWPQMTLWSGRGIVPSGITAIAFTDAGANEGAGWDDTSTYNNPWLKVDDPRMAGVASWFLMIDDCDHRKVIKTAILSSTATTLNYVSILDYITSGYVPSLASLVGKDYQILRGDYGVTWADRFIEFPNDYTYADGVVEQYHDNPDDLAEVTNPTAHSLKQTKDRAWKVNEHAGRDLLVYVGSGAKGQGNLRRVSITSNTATTLTFAPQSWTPAVGADYCIVASGDRAYPGKAGVYPDCWYRGGTGGVFGHLPEPVGGDYAASAPYPKDAYEHQDFDPFFGCTTVHPFAFDVEYITENSNDTTRLDCGYPPDKVFSRDLWKTWRGLQKACEEVCGDYVEDKSYTGSKSIPLLGPATYFKAWGKNAATVVPTAVSVGVSATVPTLPFPFYPVNLFYAVLGPDGETLRGGVLVATTATTLTDTGWVADDVGRTVVVSAGWDRFYPREFQRFYSKCCFIPDTKTDEDGNEYAVDPPTIDDYATDGCLGAGKWEYRAPSAKYWEQQEQGRPAEGDNFRTGDKARYVGDNFWDGIERAFSAVLAPYMDHFYTGLLGRLHEKAIAKQRIGAAESSTSFSITDADQNWFDYKWYAGAGGFYSRREEGTFTSGSTLGGTDSTKASGEGNCTWAASRFTNMSPFERFTVEVLLDGAWDDEDAVIEKRLIRTGTAAGALTWLESLPTSASGKPYRIYEPAYELNRYRGRTMHITDADNVKATVVIQGNDATTLFFNDLGYVPTAPVRYAIDEEEIGAIYKWDGTKHVKVDRTTGADAVRTFVPTPTNFISPSWANLPTYVHRFGRMRRGDDVVAVIQQLYYGIKALKKTRHDVFWTRTLAGVDQDNWIHTVAGNEEDWPHGGWTKDTYAGHFTPSGCELDFLNADGVFPSDAAAWALMWGLLEDGGSLTDPPWDCQTISYSGWGAATPSFSSDPPQVIATGSVTANGMEAGADRVFQYGIAAVGQPKCTIPNKLTYYAYAIIQSGDPDEGGTCTTSTQWNEYHFQAHSDPVLFRQFSAWYTEGSYSTVPDRQSGPLGIHGLTDPPGTPPLPVATGACTSPDNFRGIVSGYYVSRQYAVADWQFQHCV